MKKILTRGFRVALLLALGAVGTAAASAQEFDEVPGDQAPPAAAGESWSYRPAAEREPNLTIAQQKAIARGEQRMARLEALRWYGFSNSRPTAAAMPWTTMYSPAWQTPGGRPFAWSMTSRPIVVITQPTPTPVYR